MTGRRLAVAAWYVTFTTITTFAAVHYVVPQNGTNAISPYLSWSTAATNIQDAVDAALSGDTVLVSNGWYTLGVSSGGYAFATNVVSITKAVTVASVGGPGVTFICGREWRPGEPPWRCVYMEQGAVLAGFNVTNGWTDPSCTNWPDAVANGGGGIHANGGIISNCIVAQCSAYLGAGIYARGGSLIAGCTITGNVTQAYSGGNGGGLCLIEGSALDSCTIIDNRANYASGGGVYIDGGTVTNCHISGCTATAGAGVYSERTTIIAQSAVTGNVTHAGGVGGGIYLGDGAVVHACRIDGNIADGWHGGGVYAAANNTIVNSLITWNRAERDGAAAWSDDYLSLDLCTVYGNITSNGAGAGIRFGWFGAIGGCIVVNNGVTNAYSTGMSMVVDSCIHPCDPAMGNIDADPLFISAASGDFGLRTNSPCRDGGGSGIGRPQHDLGGSNRLVHTACDMGAFESPNYPPFMPLNISPANSQRMVPVEPYLASGPLADPDPTSALSGVAWQIADGSTDIVWDVAYSKSTNLAVRVPADVLRLESVYLWRARHKDEYGAWGEWSEFTWFETESNAVPFVAPSLIMLNTNQSGATVDLRNRGGWHYAYTASVLPGSSWLNITPQAGTVSNQTDVLVVSTSRAGLTNGLHTGYVSIVPSVGAPFTVTCVLAVARAAVSADAGGPYRVSQGESLMLDASRSRGDGLAFQWLLGTNVLAEYAASNVQFHCTLYAPGTNQVIVNVTDTNLPPQNASATTDVVVANVAPAAELDGPFSARTGMPVMITARISEPGTGDMVSVRWDFGDGMSSNWLAVARGSCTTSVAHAFWSGGEFAIRCTVRDQHGASNSSYAVALVDSSNRPPVAMIAVAGATGPVVHLPGMTVDVDLDGLRSTDDWTAVGAMTFDWREDVANPAGPLLSPHARTQRSLRITDFPLPGVYRIHLVVNDGEYNSAPATVEFRVPGLSAFVRSENESMLPLYGVQLCVTNRATGRVDIESTDFDGWCALDTGEGDNIEIALERNGARKCAVTSVDQSGSVGRTLTFPAPLCAFSACVSAYTNATAYAPLPYAGVEIIVGNEIAFAGSADLDGGIAVGDVPELWPLGPTVNYQVRYQKPGYESALLPLQVDRNCVTWHRPALHPASAITATGIVVGLSSMPVEGASVELGAAFPTVMTGPDGRFVCAGIMPGAYLARMTAPGFVPSFATVSILDGQESQQLTIRGGTFSVHGGVYDAYSPGHPVSNVLVSVLDSRGAPLAYAWSSDIGYYDITVVRGARRLRYDADGYGPQIIPLDVQSHVRQDVFLETPEPAAALCAVLAFILARSSAKSK